MTYPNNSGEQIQGGGPPQPQDYEGLYAPRQQVGRSSEQDPYRGHYAPEQTRLQPPPGLPEPYTDARRRPVHPDDYQAEATMRVAGRDATGDQNASAARSRSSHAQPRANTATMTAAATFWYVLGCIAMGGMYFAKVPCKKALEEAGLATMTSAERFWYVLGCLPFGAFYFCKLPVKKALTEATGL
jgi:hypothetical protein